jgi:ferredoxin
MADAANKYPENVEGKFYVDDQCIDCDLCRETAPDEEALCKEAMEGCPVEAIGSDGA